MVWNQPQEGINANPQRQGSYPGNGHRGRKEDLWQHKKFPVYLRWGVENGNDQEEAGEEDGGWGEYRVYIGYGQEGDGGGAVAGVCVWYTNEKWWSHWRRIWTLRRNCEIAISRPARGLPTELASDAGHA